MTKASQQKSDRYFERGGIRYGASFQSGYSNFTWPFATMCLGVNVLELEIHLGPLKLRKFTFDQSDVKVLRKRNGLLSHGVQIEHSRDDYPSVIVFWTFHQRRLLRAAEEAGYEVERLFPRGSSGN